MPVHWIEFWPPGQKEDIGHCLQPAERFPKNPGLQKHDWTREDVFGEVMFAGQELMDPDAQKKPTRQALQFVPLGP